MPDHDEIPQEDAAPEPVEGGEDTAPVEGTAQGAEQATRNREDGAAQQGRGRTE